MEIDRRVVETSIEYLPEIACGLKDPKVEVHYKDGIKYVQDHKNEFDIILVDSTDPIGPAVGLFEGDFYKSCHEALKEDGIFVAQTESPYYNEELIPKVQKDIRANYPITKLYLAFIPTYPGGCWSFTMDQRNMIPRQWISVTGLVTKPGIITPKYIRQPLFCQTLSVN
ncbi:hypothetical protein N752_17410 [Desulforamulus aquiferis]|nr:hypothetical protein N752_17410 [Desulforamulus aquiferis]